MSTKVIGFPSNPSVDDEYQGWVWDGDKWVSDAVKGGLWEQNGDDIYYNDGNVGIGMTPISSTFKLSAKEQLAEWKTKAKASTWSEVTDGEFSQEPTEDLVAEWIEERSDNYQNSQLQLKGYLSFGLNGGAILKIEDPENSGGSGLVTLGVTALSDSSKRWFSFGESVQDNAAGLKASVFKVGAGSLRIGVGTGDIKGLCIANNGDTTFSGTVNADEVSSSMMKLTNNGRIVRTDANGIGLYLEGGSGNVILPTDNKGGLKSDGPSLGNAGRKFLDAYFSGTVDAAGFTINGVPISGGLPPGDFTHNGVITATDFIAKSDERLKTRIAPMPVGLIDDIKPVSWDWIDGGGKSAGVVAQQLQEIGLGDYVHENEDGQLGVNYQALTAILLAEVIALKQAIK